MANLIATQKTKLLAAHESLKVSESALRTAWDSAEGQAEKIVVGHWLRKCRELRDDVGELANAIEWRVAAAPE